MWDDDDKEEGSQIKPVKTVSLEVFGPSVRPRLNEGLRCTD